MIKKPRPAAIDLSIIIPAYREAERIEASLKTLAEFIKDRDYGRVEVIVMAQSDDDSGAAAQHDAKYFHDFRVINLGQRSGKGGAVRAGMFEARGRYRMFMDADLATPLEHLDDVHGLMERRGKVGIAVRNLFTIHKNPRRALISKVSNLAVQLLLLPGIKDTQCGFKVFEAEAAKAIFSRQTITSWSFDVEILAIARYLGFRIETFEAPDWRDPKPEASGLSGDSPLKVAIREAQDPLLIRWNLWAGQYTHPSFTYEPEKT